MKLLAVQGEPGGEQPLWAWAGVGVTIDLTRGAPAAAPAPIRTIRRRASRRDTPSSAVRLLELPCRRRGELVGLVGLRVVDEHLVVEVLHEQVVGLPIGGALLQAAKRSRSGSRMPFRPSERKRKSPARAGLPPSG
jgi:hypothetical protein